MAYAVFVGIHLAGVGEALRVMFVITAIALVGLVVFAGAAGTQFDLANLTDIAPTDAAGASAFLPFGYLGIWSASWMILGPHLSDTEIGEKMSSFFRSLRTDRLSWIALGALLTSAISVSLFLGVLTDIISVGQVTSAAWVYITLVGAAGSVFCCCPWPGSPP